MTSDEISNLHDLHYLQGVFVSILYCFMCSDVRRVLKNIYHRTNTRRGLLSSKTSIKSRENRGGSNKRGIIRSEKAYNSFELNLNGFKTSKKSSSFNGQQNGLIEETRLLPVHKSCCVSINDLQFKTTIFHSDQE